MPPSPSAYAARAGRPAPGVSRLSPPSSLHDTAASMQQGLKTCLQEGLRQLTSAHKLRTQRQSAKSLVTREANMEPKSSLVSEAGGRGLVVQA